MLAAPLTTLAVTISGVSTTAALITKLEASNPSRAMPRELIDERPFADGLVRQRGFVCLMPLRTKVKLSFNC